MVVLLHATTSGVVTNVNKCVCVTLYNSIYTSMTVPLCMYGLMFLFLLSHVYYGQTIFRNASLYTYLFPCPYMLLRSSTDESSPLKIKG